MADKERFCVDSCIGMVGEFFLGSMDDETIKNLRLDTYPGLVLEFPNLVHWVNDVYVQFASGQNRGGDHHDHHQPLPEIKVRLVAKGRLPTW